MYDLTIKFERGLHACIQLTHNKYFNVNLFLMDCQKEKHA